MVQFVSFFMSKQYHSSPVWGSCVQYLDLLVGGVSADTIVGHVDQVSVDILTKQLPIG